MADAFTLSDTGADEYYGSEVRVNDRVITSTTGKKFLSVGIGTGRSYDLYYDQKYEIRGMGVEGGIFTVKPSKYLEDRQTIVSLSTDYVWRDGFGLSVGLSAGSVIFDFAAGRIQLRDALGEIKISVSPCRGYAVPFGYGGEMIFYTTLTSPSELTVYCTDSAFVIECSGTMTKSRLEDDEQTYASDSSRYVIRHNPNERYTFEEAEMS